ncbi:hypothetical protein SSS_04046 [Sarcoptes scabiei]|nr:hypothetical protein SSS_04046 [Sarcoptes scabiei]
MIVPKRNPFTTRENFSLRKRYINFVLRYQKIIELNSPISFMIDKLSASINEVEKIASNQLLNTDQKRSQSPALLSSLPSSLSSSSSSLSSLAKKADSAITTVITDKVKHVKDKFMIEFEAQIDDEDSTIEYDEDETKFEIIKSKKILWQQEIDRILRKNNSRVLVRKCLLLLRTLLTKLLLNGTKKSISFLVGS